MKLMFFMMTVLITLCSVGMLYGAVTTPSPMHGFNVIVFCVIFMLCLVLNVLTYNEMKE